MNNHLLFDIILGGSESHIIDASNVPVPGKKVTFREQTAWKETEADVVVVSCTRSPPRKRKGKRTRPDRSTSFDKKNRSARSLSSDSDPEATHSTYTSDSDASPARRKPEDHHLKNSDNPKLIEWLKQKNKIHRKQKAKERKEEREKEKARRKEEEAKLVRKQESQKKVQEWMLAKKRQSSKSRERNTSRPRRAVQSDSEDENNVEYLEGGGKIRVETKKIERRDEAEGKDNDEVTAERESIKDDEENKNENVESDANEKEDGEKENKAEIKPLKEKTKRGRKRHRLKMAQKIISSDDIPEIPPSAGMNGHIPLKSRQLPKIKKRKTKLQKKKKEEPDEKPVDEEKQKRFSYDAWLKQKQEQDKKQRQKEKSEKAKAASEVTPELANVVSTVAQNRMKSLRDQKKRIDTGLPDIDAAANKQYPSSKNKHNEKEDIEETNKVTASMYRLETKNKDNENNLESKKKSRVRLRSSSNSRFKTPTPQKSKSLPQKSKLTKSNSKDSSDIVPSPPTTTRSFPPRPRLRSAAHRKVKREQKSWEEFADHVWEKLNTDSDSERPDPQGSSDEGTQITAEKVKNVSEMPAREPVPMPADPIVINVPNADITLGEKAENVRSGLPETETDKANRNNEDYPKPDLDSVVEATTTSQTETQGTFFLTENTNTLDSPKEESTEEDVNSNSDKTETPDVEADSGNNSINNQENEGEVTDTQQTEEELVSKETDDGIEDSIERRRSVTFAEEAEVKIRTPSSSSDSGEAQEVDEALDIDNDDGDNDNDDDEGDLNIKTKSQESDV